MSFQWVTWFWPRPLEGQCICRWLVPATYVHLYQNIQSWNAKNELCQANCWTWRCERLPSKDWCWRFHPHVGVRLIAHVASGTYRSRRIDDQLIRSRRLHIIITYTDARPSVVLLAIETVVSHNTALFRHISVKVGYSFKSCLLRGNGGIFSLLFVCLSVCMSVRNCCTDLAEIFHTDVGLSWTPHLASWWRSLQGPTMEQEMRFFSLLGQSASLWQPLFHIRSPDGNTIALISW